MATIDLKHTTIRIRDGQVADALAEPPIEGPNELEIRIGEGNLTYSERRNLEYRRNRGILDTVREGDEEPMEVNFEFEWEFLRSDTGEPVTIEESLKKVGAAAGWVSSSADPCEPYSIDLVIEYIPFCSDAKSEVIVLEDFRWDSLDHNLSDGNVSCKGQCNAVQALISRVAAEEAQPMMATAPDYSHLTEEIPLSRHARAMVGPESQAEPVD